MLKSIFNYKLLIAVIVFIIIFIRIPALTARTIHIDEGMGIKASEQLLSGTYSYWPKNGHGPTLFYFGALIRKITGINIIFFRAITTIFMLLALLILWLIYRRELNKAGEVLLLLGLGLSSGMLFFSAYFIHEALFILLTVFALAFAELWLKTKNGVWLTFFIIFASLMYMTKETALFTYASWSIAVIIILFWQKNLKYILKQLISLKNIIFIILGCIVSLILYLIFFGKSLDLIIAPFFWLKERGLTMHIRPWYYFIILLSLHEFFLLIISIVAGTYITLKKMWEPRLAFFILWFLLILIAYSVIPYKTPWLIPNMILPLGLFMAFSVSVIWKKTDKVLLASFIIILLIISLTGLLFDNIIHPDRSEKYDYAYLQSGIGFREFMAIIDGISSLNKNETLPIQIIWGHGDELLDVMTEKYSRQFKPFVPNMPLYINYFNSAEDMKKTLSQTDYEYVFLKFTYIINGPDIDIFIRKDKWDAYKNSPNFIKPQSIWPDGTMRYQ